MSTSTPGLTPYISRALPLAERSVANGSIGSSYALVGTVFSQPIFYLSFTSTLDGPVQISLDGVNDFVTIPQGNSVPVYIEFPWHNFGTVLTGAYGVYAKKIGSYTTGSLYVCAVSVQ